MTDESNTTDPYPNAGRASGYTDEQGRAIGEDLINRVTELLAAVQTKVLTVGDNMDALAKHQDQRFGYVLNQLDAFLKTEDSRHDTYARELDRIGRTSEQVLTTLSEVAARQGKLEADHVELAGLVSDLGENLSETRGDVDVLKLDMHSVKTEIVAVKEELLTIKTTVGVIASEQAEMKASLAYMRQRLDDNPPPEAVARLMKPDANQ